MDGKTLNRVTRLVAYLIIVGTAATVTKMIFVIWWLDKTELLTLAVVEKADQNAMALALSLIFVGMTMPAFGLMFRKIGPQHAAVMIIIGFWLYPQKFIEHDMHFYLIRHGAHPLQLLGDKGNISPQWMKVLVGGPLYISFLVALFRKKFRTPDRVFVVLISTSIFMTLALFHAVLTHGLLAPALEASRIEAGAASFLPEPTLKNHCYRIGATCFVFQGNSYDPAKVRLLAGAESDLADPTAVQFFTELSEHYSSFQSGYFAKARGVDSPGSTFLFRTFAFKKTDGISVGVIIAKETMLISMRSAMWFAFCCLAAHGVWLYGGLFLLFWHKRRQTRRVPSSAGAPPPRNKQIADPA